MTLRVSCNTRDEKREKAKGFRGDQRERNEVKVRVGLE